MKKKGCFIQFTVFIFIISVTALLGALIATGIYYRWPRVTDRSWEQHGQLPSGAISQIYVGNDFKIYAEMADGKRYVHHKPGRIDRWKITRDEVESFERLSFCPRLRPEGKVVAEFCYDDRSMGDEIVVALADGTVWSNYMSFGGDNHGAFKVVMLFITMCIGGLIGLLPGIGIFFVWRQKYLRSST